MKKILFWFLMLFLSLTCGCDDGQTLTPEEPELNLVKVATEQFIDQTTLNQAWLKMQPVNLPAPALAMTAPHHTLAAGLTASMVAAWQTNPPQCIIVVGPKHYDLGPPIITAPIKWQTAYGQLEPEPELYQELAAINCVKVYPALFQKDHAVGAIAPIIKKLLPDTKIIPLALDNGVKMADLQAIAKVVAPHIKDGTVLLGSLDFSHGLSQTLALSKDAETWQLVVQGQASQVLALDNSHVDGAAALALIMLVMQACGSEPNLVLHSDATAFLGHDAANITSYLGLVWQ